MKHPWDRRLGFWWLAEEYPDQPAVVGCPSGVTLTFSELAGRAHRLVHGLRAQGLGAGDIFAYALPNDVDMLCWQLAANEGGFQSIALNPALSGAEIQRIVDHSGSSGPGPAQRLRRSGGPDVGHRVDQAPHFGRRRHRRFPVRGVAGRGPAALSPSLAGPPPGQHPFIAYSSGTTGAAGEGGGPAGSAHHRPVRGGRFLQELRPRLPVPAAHGGPPGVGRDAPRWLPELLPGALERRCRRPS